MPDARIPTVVVGVDWTLSDNFDDVTNNIRSDAGISVEYGKDGARPRAPAMVNAADITLNNIDSRYTSENTGSDIAPYVLPDRPVRVGIQTGTDQGYEAAIAYDAAGVYYQGVGQTNIFDGLTDEPEELSSTYGRERHVQIRALGSLSWLHGLIVSTDLMTDVRTDQCVNILLDEVGWPTDKRRIATGDTLVNYWWVSKQDAYEALMDILETEGAGASLYEDGQGYINFENRLFRSTQTRCTTSQATFSARGTDIGFTAFEYSRNAREVFNDVSMTIRTGAVRTQQVWEYGKQLVLGTSETFSIVVALEDPVEAITTPTVTTDYVVTAGSVSSFTATRLDATALAITIVAGGGGLTIDGPGGSTQGPRVRGNQWTLVYQATATQTAAPDSRFASRAKSLKLDEEGANQDISLPYAQALCDSAAAYYAVGRPIVKIEIVNRDATRLAQMSQRQVSDRITIDGGPNQFSGDVWIEQLNYSIRDSGREVRMGIIGTKCLTGTGYVFNPALWDSGAWDEGIWA